MANSNNNYKQGDIVWVDFPFAQSATTKKRPAVIVSNKDCHKDENDCILAAVTTTIRVTNYSFLLDSTNVTQTLPANSEVRSNKLFTQNQKLFQGKLSEIVPSKIDELLKMVQSAIKKD